MREVRIEVDPDPITLAYLAHHLYESGLFTDVPTHKQITDMLTLIVGVLQIKGDNPSGSQGNDEEDQRTFPF